MPDEQHEREPDEMEGMLGTVLKSLFGKVDEGPQQREVPPEASEEEPAEGSVPRVVLDRVNGRLERGDGSEPERPRALRDATIGEDTDMSEGEARTEEPIDPKGGPEPEPLEAPAAQAQPADLSENADPAAEPFDEPPPSIAEAAAAAAAAFTMKPLSDEPRAPAEAPAEAATEPPEAPAEAARPAPPTEGPVGERLSHPDAEVRSLALEELRGRPDDVPLEAVRMRLTDPDPSTRRKAVEILGEIPEEAVVLQLLDAMQDPSEDVRAAARTVFERRRSDSLVRLLRQELPKPARGRAAAVLLSELGEVDMLIRAMADADPETRSLIREVLESAGVTERLIADLSDPHPDLRLAAADRLGVMRATRAVPDLIRRLEDPDPRVRTNAANALGAIGESSAIQSLKLALLADPDPSVVESLVQSLRRLANPQT
jgi:HEAT repeat protein